LKSSYGRFHHDGYLFVYHGVALHLQVFNKYATKKYFWRLGHRAQRGEAMGGEGRRWVAWGGVAPSPKWLPRYEASKEDIRERNIVLSSVS